MPLETLNNKVKTVIMSVLLAFFISICPAPVSAAADTATPTVAVVRPQPKLDVEERYQNELVASTKERFGRDNQDMHNMYNSNRKGSAITTNRRKSMSGQNVAGTVLLVSGVAVATRETIKRQQTRQKEIHNLRNNRSLLQLNKINNDTKQKQNIQDAKESPNITNGQASSSSGLIKSSKSSQYNSPAPPSMEISGNKDSNASPTTSAPTTTTSPAKADTTKAAANALLNQQRALQAKLDAQKQAQMQADMLIQKRELEELQARLQAQEESLKDKQKRALETLRRMKEKRKQAQAEQIQREQEERRQQEQQQVRQQKEREKQEAAERREKEREAAYEEEQAFTQQERTLASATEEMVRQLTRQRQEEERIVAVRAKQEDLRDKLRAIGLNVDAVNKAMGDMASITGVNPVEPSTGDVDPPELQVNISKKQKAEAAARALLATRLEMEQKKRTQQAALAKNPARVDKSSNDDLHAKQRSEANARALLAARLAMEQAQRNKQSLPLAEPDSRGELIAPEQTQSQAKIPVESPLTDDSAAALSAKQRAEASARALLEARLHMEQRQREQNARDSESQRSSSPVKITGPTQLSIGQQQQQQLQELEELENQAAQVAANLKSQLECKQQQIQQVDQLQQEAAEMGSKIDERLEAKLQLEDLKQRAAKVESRAADRVDQRLTLAKLEQAALRIESEAETRVQDRLTELRSKEESHTVGSIQSSQSNPTTNFDLSGAQIAERNARMLLQTRLDIEAREKARMKGNGVSASTSSEVTPSPTTSTVKSHSAKTTDEDEVSCKRKAEATARRLLATRLEMEQRQKK